MAIFFDSQVTGSSSATGSFGRMSVTTAKIGDAEIKTLDDGKYLFVGADVGTNVTGVTGDALIGFGYDVLSALPGTARRNVAVGYNTQNVNTNGQYNTSIGYEALRDQGDGDYNTAVGQGALASSTSASYSTAVGAVALGNAATGNGNTAVGYAAASSLAGSTGGVTAIGSAAGLTNTGGGNTFVGYEAFRSHNTGNTSNTIIGYRAMYGGGSYEHTAMSNNVAVGHEAAYRFHKGSNNTFIGGGAVAYYYVTGSENTVIGTGTAPSLSTGPYDLGHENFIHGVSAGTKLDGAEYNIMMGRQAGQSLSTGDSNVLIGRSAATALTTGFDNVAIGYAAGTSADTNQDSIYIGKSSTGTSGAANEIVIGHEAVGKGSNTVVLGDDNITDIYLSEDVGATVHTGTVSGSIISTGSFGLVMQNGKHFPQTNAPGENIAFGTDAGSAFVGGNVNKINIAIGSSAGTAMADYGGNVFIGKNAAKLRTRGDDNVVIGTDAGGTDGDDFGDKNVFIGLKTGRDINSTNSDGNVMIGNNAGLTSLQSIANVLIGDRAGNTLTNSSRNVAIGVFAGTGDGVTNTTTENGVYIGQYALTGTTNANNETVIGSSTTGKGSNTVTIGNASVTDIYLSSDVGAKVHTGDISGSITSTGSFGQLVTSDKITAGGLITTPGNIQFGTAGVNNFVYSLGNVILQAASGYGIVLDAGAGDDEVTLTTTSLTTTVALTGSSATFSGNVGIGTDSPSTMLHLKSSTSTTPKITIEDTNADDNFGALQFIKDSASPGTGDKLMQIWAYGDNDAAEQILYSEIATLPTSVADGSEEGSMRFRVMSGGSFVETMRVRANKVGIGTDNPDTNLHIHKASAGSVTTNTNSQFTIENNSHASMQFLSPNNANSIIYFGDVDDNDVGYINYVHSTNTMNFQTNTAIRMAVSADAIEYPTANYKISGSITSTGSFGHLLVNGSVVGDSFSNGSATLFSGSRHSTASFGGLTLDANINPKINFKDNDISLGEDALSGVGNSHNVAIGYRAAAGSTSGYQVAIGYLALSGSGGANNHNVAIGTETLSTNIDANNFGNTAVGGYALQSGSYRYATAVGYAAAQNYDSTSPIVAIGYNAGKSVPDSNFVAIGSNALNTTGSAANSVAIGMNALQNNNTANASVAVGDNALSKNTTGGFNIAVGRYALQDATTANSNIAIGGYGTLMETTTGGSNIAVGTQAMEKNLTGITNIAIGGNAMRYHTDSDYNVAIGSAAMQNVSVGTFNVALGYHAGYNTGGDNNVMIGQAAGYSSGPTTVDFNVFIGYYAGRLFVSGSDNVGIGKNAMYQAGKLGTNATDNVAVGENALYNAGGLRNVGIGLSAMSQMTVGNDNVAVGYGAGQQLASGNRTSGSNSVYVGQLTKSGTNNSSNEIVIGSNAIGKGTNTVVLGDDTITDIYLSEDVGAEVHLGALTMSGSAPMIKLKDTDDHSFSRIYHSAGRLIFDADHSDGTQQANSYISLRVDDSEKMRISGSGNVGIGTSNPQNLLHLSDVTPALLMTDEDDNSEARVVNGGGNLYLDADLNDEISNSFIALRTDNGSEKVRITSTGRVGIGTSSPASATGFNSSNLTIHGADPSLVISDSGQDNLQICTHANAFKFINDSDDRAFFIIEENATVNSLYIDDSGHIGINNSSPTMELEIYQSTLAHGSNVGIRLYAENDSGTARDGHIIFDPDTQTVGLSKAGSAVDLGVTSTTVESVKNVNIDTGGTTSLTVDGNNSSGDDGRIYLKGHTSAASRAYININNGVSSGGQNWYVGALRGSNSFAIGRGDDFGTNTDFYVDSSGHAYFDNNAYISNDNAIWFGNVADNSDTSAVFTNTSDNLVLRTGGNVDSVKIDPSGSVLVGPNVTNGTKYIMLHGTAHGQIDVGGAGTSLDTRMSFINANGSVGTIKTTGTATQFNTSSDYRLKENEVVISDGLIRLGKLKPYRFNFKTDKDTTVDGFFAHEVAEIVPEAISGEKDAVDSDGNIDAQGIDHSKLVPLLVKAVQELTQKVEELEEKIK